MGVGSPHRLIEALVERGARDLTIVANDTARPGYGIGKLISAGAVSRVIASHIGLNPETQEKMISGIKNGLYVTGLRGLGTDVPTGTYSCGASGFWIQDGEVAFPVDGITLGGNVLDMLKNIEVVADDLDLRGGLNSPSFKISEMTIGGKK